jgi:predicted nucleic acid-binding protein
VPTRTFIDSGVLIAVARGAGDVFAAAFAVLDDPQRTFISSDFIRLEVLPKALFHGNVAEAQCYEAFFASVDEWVSTSPELVAAAFEQAQRQNLNALDALHVTASLRARADEFVTTERPNSPLLHVSGLRVTTLYRV